MNLQKNCELVHHKTAAKHSLQFTDILPSLTPNFMCKRKILFLLLPGNAPEKNWCNPSLP